MMKPGNYLGGGGTPMSAQKTPLCLQLLSENVQYCPDRLIKGRHTSKKQHHYYFTDKHAGT